MQSTTPKTTELYGRAVALENDLRGIIEGTEAYHAELLRLAVPKDYLHHMRNPDLVEQLHNLYQLVESMLYMAERSGMAHGDRDAYLHSASLTAASARRIIALNRD